MTDKELIEIMKASPLIGWCMDEWDKLLNQDDTQIVRCRNCSHNTAGPDAGNANCELVYGMTDQYGFRHMAERERI